MNFKCNILMMISIGVAEGGSGRFKSRAKTLASTSSRVCLDIHVYVYGCEQMCKSGQWNNVK